MRGVQSPGAGMLSGPLRGAWLRVLFCGPHSSSEQLRGSLLLCRVRGWHRFQLLCGSPRWCWKVLEVWGCVGSRADTSCVGWSKPDTLR